MPPETQWHEDAPEEDREFISQPRETKPSPTEIAIVKVENYTRTREEAERIAAENQKSQAN